ncbi:L-threonylcarbamoyladenylate synthase [Pokkaliibacter sp. CJK22405]|uniref:L-threonylcarbamoyladenylate synthase n=1 Tax=Pokkaliibacter sp. CJK22405 TaxID=3384615 RepID=UPI0039849F98
MSPLFLRRAVETLSLGGVLAYPTEAVWGVGCDPWNPDAFVRLLRLKQRPPEKGVILVAATMEQIAPLLLHVTPEQREKLNATWPGPCTWIMPDPENWIPTWIKGQHDKVAVRVSSHPVVQALCHAWYGPLVSTSANPSGAEPARSRLRIQQYFGGRVDGILPGELGKEAKPSRIFDLESGKQLR